jgi:rod shape determining protein RodA
VALQVDRRLITHFDWTFACTVLAMVGVGILTIYSSNALATSAFRKSLYLRQVTWVGIGLVGLLLACTISYRNLARFAYVIFGLTFFALIVVLVIGKAGLGAQRWIRLGPITVQPSEFAKLALILFLARYFDDHRDALRNPRTLVLPAALTGAFMLLVLKQPDLGTALLLGFIALGMFLLVGLRIRYLLPFLGGGALLAPVIWTFLKEYQKRRILVFLNPEIDPLGASYHIAQSKIAVGSGGLLGKGFLGATQSQLNFLPLNHTDFIFAVLAEQWGFLGCLMMLVLFFYLVTRGLQIARDCTDLFAALLAAGVSLMIGIQALINISMVLGLLPVVGIPLPLVSYGGSSLVVTLLAIGLLMNIHMRRFMY